MRRHLIGLVVLVAASSVGVVLAVCSAAPASSQLVLSARGAACKPVIAGAHVCLKLAERCKPTRDREYHRYGFHCHTGKLTRRASPLPGPQLPPPPVTRQPAPPGPGQRVDVGGYSLYIECEGSGSPTVIMEHGFGIASATGDAIIPTAGWRAVRTALAGDTRVCAYDRANLGASDDRSSTAVPPAATLTNELRTLVANASISGPFVVVGGSFGGLVSLSHLILAPQMFIGLVLLDSVEPCPSGCTFSGPDRVTFDSSIATAPLGDRPLVALTSGLDTFLTSNLAKGPDLARRSTNSLWASTPGSGHGIAETRTQAVIEAVRLVLAAARTGGKLPTCEQTSLPALGASCGS